MLSDPSGAIDGSVRVGTCRYIEKSSGRVFRSKDILHEFAVPLADDERMMLQLRVLLPHADIQQEHAHRNMQPVDRLVGPATRPVFGRDEILVHPRHIAVGNDDIRIMHLATNTHTSCCAIAHHDLLHIRIRSDRTAEFKEELFERLHQTVHPATGEPDTRFALEIRDHDVDARCAERRPADEERMEREREAVVLVPEVLADVRSRPAAGRRA